MFKLGCCSPTGMPTTDVAVVCQLFDKGMPSVFPDMPPTTDMPPTPCCDMSPSGFSLFTGYETPPTTPVDEMTGPTTAGLSEEAVLDASPLP